MGFVFDCNFFNPAGKNHIYLEEFVLGKSPNVTHGTATALES